MGIEAEEGEDAGGKTREDSPTPISLPVGEEEDKTLEEEEEEDEEEADSMES